MQHEQQGPLQHEQLKLLHRGGPPLRGGAGPLAAALPSASGAVAADAEPEACLPDLQWQATRHLQEGPSFIAASGSVQEGIAASNSQCSPTHQGGMKQRSTTPPPALPKREAIAITNVSGSNDSSTLLSTICCTSLYPTLDALQQRHHHRTDAIMSTGRNQIEQAEPAAAPRTVSVRTHDCRFISHIRQPLGDPHAQHQALNMAGDRSLVGLHKTLEEQRLNSEGDRIGSMAAGVEKLQQPKDEKYEQGGLDSAHGLLADIIVRQLIEDEMERKRHRQQLMLNVDDGINGLSSQRDHRIFEKVTHAGERKVDMGAKEGLSVMGKEAVVAAEEEEEEEEEEEGNSSEPNHWQSKHHPDSSSSPVATLPLHIGRCGRSSHPANSSAAPHEAPLTTPRRIHHTSSQNEREEGAHRSTEERSRVDVERERRHRIR